MINHSSPSWGRNDEVMIFVSESCMVLYCCCQYQRRQYQQSINVVSIGEVTMFVSESCMVLYCCRQYHCRQYQCHHQYQLLYIFGAVLLVSVSWSSSISRSLPVLTIRSNNDWMLAKLLLFNIGRTILWNIILSICLIFPKSLTYLLVTVI